MILYILKIYAYVYVIHITIFTTYFFPLTIYFNIEYAYRMACRVITAYLNY